MGVLQPPHIPDEEIVTAAGAVVAETKSRAGPPTVGIPAPLVAVLRQHRAHQDRNRAGSSPTCRRPGPSPGRSQRVAGTAYQSGVRDARLHDARRTASTMLLLLDVPSRALMDVMSW